MNVMLLKMVNCSFFSELVKHEITKRDQAIKLLEVLCLRGPKAFQSLVNALRHDYDYLAVLLEKTTISPEEIEKSSFSKSPRPSVTSCYGG